MQKSGILSTNLSQGSPLKAFGDTLNPINGVPRVCPAGLLTAIPKTLLDLTKPYKKYGDGETSKFDYVWGDGARVAAVMDLPTNSPLLIDGKNARTCFMQVLATPDLASFYNADHGDLFIFFIGYLPLTADRTTWRPIFVQKIYADTGMDTFKSLTINGTSAPKVAIGTKTYLMSPYIQMPTYGFEKFQLCLCDPHVIKGSAGYTSEYTAGHIMTYVSVN